MTFEIEVGGRQRAVTVEGTGRADRYRMTIDGRPLEVSARRTGAHGLLLAVLAGAGAPPPRVPGTFPAKVPATLADKSLGQRGLRQPATEDPHKKVPATFAGKVPGTGKQVELAVTPSGAAAEVLVTVRGRLAVVTVNGRRTGHPADTGRHSHGEQPVVAPMPGRVVRVLVAPGDEVAARQGVVVVEAMKMENELRAPKKGLVKDVRVSPGTSVEAGRVLVVIE
jgi:biotin carboxyl carrier protein